MKRLLDESTDELTRSLLQAGAEDRPPPGNQRQLLVALGAGSALGLFSSNAFAWLGTTAGKVTAAGVAVGVAGAVLVAGPLLRPADDGGRVASAGHTVTREAAPQVAQEPIEPEPVASGSGRTGSGAERESDTESAWAASVEDSSVEGSSARALPDEAIPSDEPVRVTPRVGAAVSRHRATSERRVARHASPSKPSRRNKQASALKAQQSASVERVKGTDDGAASTPEARRARLDAEVRRVDEMHAAARRSDREALARLVAAYHAEFPEGQLKKEVADFESRLEQPGAF